MTLTDRFTRLLAGVALGAAAFVPAVVLTTATAGAAPADPPPCTAGEEVPIPVLGEDGGVDHVNCVPCENVPANIAATAGCTPPECDPEIELCEPPLCLDLDPEQCQPECDPEIEECGEPECDPETEDCEPSAACDPEVEECDEPHDEPHDEPESSSVPAATPVAGRPAFTG